MTKVQSNTAEVKDIAWKKSIDEAERKARLREVMHESDAESLLDFVKERYSEITGKEIDFYQKKDQNQKVAFAQIIQHNVQALVEFGYLSQAEESFLFKISGYLDFKTNIIVEKSFKNKKTREENEAPKAATPSYIASLMDVSREHASRMMNQLKKKGVLATAEVGMTTDDGRVCTSRTWFVNPNLLYCGDKSNIDRTVQTIFKDALKNIKDKDGKKIKLPVQLFL